MASDKHRGRQTQQAGHRLLPLVTAGFFTLALVVAGFYASEFLNDPRNLPLQVIDVRGEFQHLDRANLESVVARSIDGGFFTADIQRIRKAVLSLPWVAEVGINRVWPDKLVMHVQEQVPVARWGEGALLNGQGEIFQPLHAMQEQPDLLFFGPEGSAVEVLDFYQRIKSMFNGDEMRIQQFGLDKRREWKAKLNSGLEIMFGKKEAEPRLRRFLGVYSVIAAEESPAARVDLRYEQGFAVKWQKIVVPADSGSGA